MIPVDILPDAYRRYRDAGGVLQFHVFEVGDGDDQTVAEAITSALWEPPSAAEGLLDLGNCMIDRQMLLGEWHDPDTGFLIRRGRFIYADGRELIDPPLHLDHGKVVALAKTVRDPEVGGDLAFAFAFPIDSLDLASAEVQPLFDEIMAVVLPRGVDAEILDWYAPELPNVLGFFASGPMAWGMFLFSIYVPELKRLTIVAGAPWD